MPRPFNRLSLEEFAQLLARFPFRRRIDSVHMHHTWRPNHRQFRGLESIEAMYRFHTRDNGWSDIAQHITIDPDGMIWTGRDWNKSPASASGHNGNSISGPFMFEMIGDFDSGRDRFAGAQRATALEVIARVQMKFDLPVSSLRFHNQMSSKTCPGSSIDYEAFLEEVERRREEISAEESGRALRAGAEDRPFTDEESEVAGRVESLLQSLSRAGVEREDPPSAETGDDGMQEHEVYRLINEGLLVPLATAEDGAGGRSARSAGDLTPEMLSSLRPHVINLRQGQFSSEGKFSTSSDDVDAIFGEHLARALAEARDEGRKLRLLFFAHGGLTSESSGLRIAHRQVTWWKSNSVYPIYFVWETGFFEIIGQLLRSGQRRALEAARDIFDFTSDPLLEAAARRLGGVTIWSGMKRSAELSVAAGGGARYVARKLKEFCDANGGDVELHAMGHSAGSIFHAHFIPTALKLGAPRFRSMHFLAPAIRVDTFKELLASKVGDGAGIDHLTVFTMKKDWERADHCAHLYRKSLLYLIHHALEPESKTPILGLEESLRKDADLTRLFGLAGNSSSAGEVIWSKTEVQSGRNASTSASHGGFDEDAPTMSSAARRILGLDDTAQIEEFPKEVAAGRALDPWQDASDWEEELEEIAPRSVRARPKKSASSAASSAIPSTAHASSTASGASKDGRPDGAGGRRLALCVGINTYPTAPLAGCVADAEEWASTLGSLGFETTLLTNEQATYDSILSELSDLVTSSRAGDVIVFQFAGHGTTLADKNKDEIVKGMPGRDEALCPHDFAGGAFIVDDDVAEIFTRIPEGVNVTCFIDCCHSGTITRFAVGDSSNGQGRSRNERPRFIVATPEMESNHLGFRKSLGRSRSFTSRGPDSMREILFSACLQSEVAWENDGHGDFTTRATQILRSGANGMSNELFQQKVVEAFGANPRQHPDLDCAQDARGRGLLSPLTSQGLSNPVAGLQGAPSGGVSSGTSSREIEAIAQGFRTIADLLLKSR